MEVPRGGRSPLQASPPLCHIRFLLKRHQILRHVVSSYPLGKSDVGDHFVGDDASMSIKEGLLRRRRNNGQYSRA
jgi:hypothetical protein